jgi:hypothetical protein
LAANGNRFVAGEVTLVDKLASPYERYELSPRQTRMIFAQKGWSRVVGFQTASVPSDSIDVDQQRKAAGLDYARHRARNAAPGDFRESAGLLCLALFRVKCVFLKRHFSTANERQ